MCLSRTMAIDVHRQRKRITTINHYAVVILVLDSTADACPNNDIWAVAVASLVVPYADNQVHTRCGGYNLCYVRLR